MKILAIDPATSCGWCYYNTDSNYIYSGVLDLSFNRFESASIRLLKLKEFLIKSIGDKQKPPFDLISYEEVRRHNSTDAAHAYGALIGVIQLTASEYGIPYTTVTVSEVKQIAVGKGGGKGTDKEAILAAADKRWPGHVFETDDEADARFIALATERKLHGSVVPHA